MHYMCLSYELKYWYDAHNWILFRVTRSKNRRVKSKYDWRMLMRSDEDEEGRAAPGLDASVSLVNSPNRAAGYLPTADRVPTCRSLKQLQPMRKLQILFLEKIAKSGPHVWPTNESLATECGRLVDFKQSHEDKSWSTFTDIGRYQLQPNEASYVRWIAGIKTHIILHSTSQHKTTW